MVSVLMMRMCLTVLHHSMSGARAVLLGIEASLGLLVTLGTIWLGGLSVHNPTFSVDLLSLALTWVLATVPALLGGTAGLLPLVSVFLLVPLTEPGKRRGSPMVTGPDTGRVTLQMRVMLLFIILTAVPANLTILGGIVLHLPILQWFGVAVGLATGLLCPWWFGRIASQCLEARGPETTQRNAAWNHFPCAGEPAASKRGSFRSSTR